MYKIDLNLTKRPDAIYLKDKSEVVICVEDYNTEITLKLTYEQFEALYDEYKKNVGEPTYQYLEDRNLNLEAKNEYLHDLIEQYEEYGHERNQSYCEREFF